MPIKKTVRLTDETIKICHNLTQTGDVVWSSSINDAIQQFSLFVEDNTPDLTFDEWNVFYCIYNGYFAERSVDEVARLHFNVSESYKYDPQVTEFIGSVDDAINFIEKVKSWSVSQKLAVIYKAKSFWRQSPVVDLDDDDDELNNKVVFPDWFDGLGEREKIGLARLELLDITNVQILVNDENYNFPQGCNLGRKSKEFIKLHINTILK